MKAYQDKESGLWKWGSNGKPIYKTKQECQTAGLRLLTDAFTRMRERLNRGIANHGK